MMITADIFVDANCFDKDTFDIINFGWSRHLSAHLFSICI